MLNFKDFYIENYEAHPGEILYKHLINVGTENSKLGKDYKLNGQSLEKIFYIIGISHDIGKYTNFFQFYIKNKGNLSNESPEVEKFISDYKVHAILGAFFYLYLMNNNVSKLKKYGFDESTINIIILGGFYAITKHHGNLDDLNDLKTREWLEKQINIISTQIDYLSNEEQIENELNYVLEQGNIEFSFEINDFKNFIKSIYIENNIKSLKQNFGNIIEDIKNTGNIVYLKIFYSSLIYSDKYKTIFQNNNMEKQKIDKYDVIQQFRQLNNFDNTKDSLNIFRNNIYYDVEQNLQQVNLDNHFYTLNAPTGSGKTYNLLNIAFNLKSKLEQENKSSKIVYGLPFTSIIDQVFEDVKKVLSNLNYDIDNTNVLLKHHYLSEINFDDENEDIQKNYDKQKFMINSWDSEIIVTTFYQVFHTIFGNKNKQLIKYPNFQNTIFILDEIQTTPYKYWGIFKEMFKILSDKLNCYFILSSATLPVFFEENESVELLPNNQKYFDNLDRTQLDLSLINDGKNIGVDELFSDIKNNLNDNPKKDFMITMNTIKSSLNIYQKILNDEEIDKDKNEIVYLSTNIIPKHRKERIQNIKNNYGKRIILICTQLIEAGVDIDLDIGYRDFAPIDSIVQVLGRINRNGKKEKGLLKLFSLIDEDNKRGSTFSSYIYDSLSRNITGNIFDGIDKIDEKDYKKLFDKYFKLIQDYKSKDDENKLWEYWSGLKFNYLNKEFKLIENTYETIDIFVNIDNESEDLKKEFYKIGNIKDINKRKKQWDKIKAKFLQYIISVNVEKVKSLGFNDKELERGLVILENEHLENYYDEDIGFNIVSKNDDILENNFI